MSVNAMEIVENIRHLGKSYLPLNLSEQFNNDGISYDTLKCDGAFDGNGCTFPAEELPPSNTVIFLDDIPFYFPSKENGQKNNMTVRYQTFDVPALAYRSLYLLGAAEGPQGESYEEELLLLDTLGTPHRVKVGLSNWLLEPVFGETIALGTSHLHYPDPDQDINRNLFSQTPRVSYLNPVVSIQMESEPYTTLRWKPSHKDDWKPRLWLQRVELPSDNALEQLRFDKENLNFHIFAMTLLLKDRC